MTAVQAFQVVEIGLVELGSQRGTCFTAGNASSQAAKPSTGEASDSRACRPKRQADGGAGPYDHLGRRAGDQDHGQAGGAQQ